MDELERRWTYVDAADAHDLLDAFEEATLIAEENARAGSQPRRGTSAGRMR